MAQSKTHLKQIQDTNKMVVVLKSAAAMFWFPPRLMRLMAFGKKKRWNFGEKKSPWCLGCWWFPWWMWLVNKSEISDFKLGNRHIFQVLPSLKLTSPKIGVSKRKGLSSNRPFPGLLLLVFRGSKLDDIPPFGAPRLQPILDVHLLPTFSTWEWNLNMWNLQLAKKILKKPTPRP